MRRPGASGTFTASGGAKEVEPHGTSSGSAAGSGERNHIATCGLSGPRRSGRVQGGLELVQTERFLEKRGVPQVLGEPVWVGVSSHQYGRQVGARPFCRPDHLRARHTGHGVVDKEHVHGRSSATLQEIKRRTAIRRLYDLVAERREVDGSDLTYLLLVIDDKHRPAATDRGLRHVSFRPRRLGFGGTERPRDIDLHLGSRTRLAPNPDSAARLARKTVDLAETEASTFTNLLRGEERLERLCQYLRRHALAGIGHGEDDVLAGSEII